MTQNAQPLMAPGHYQAVVGTGIPQPASVVVSVQTANAAPPPPPRAEDALESQPPLAPAGQDAGKKKN